MRWSVTIGRFKGTAVRIHVTFLLFLAWIGFYYYTHGGPEAAKRNVLFIVAIFCCVVLHEFGHILTARRYGVESPEVTLLPIGGVADMSRMPQKPSQELLIALAGPAVNIAIALLLVAGVALLDPAALPNPEAPDGVARLGDPGGNIVLKLAGANLFLALFNLVPAFPMDGGRVLRAALAMWLGQEKATRIAAQIGQGLALALGFLGLMGNPILLLIAVFVFMAAAGEAQMTLAAEAARGVRVADAMETRIAALGWGASVGEAVDTLLATSQEEFPVVDGGGRLMGMLSRPEIIEALRNGEPGQPLAPFARKDVETIDGDATLDTALERLAAAPALGVVNVEGKLVGLVTRQSIAEVMMIRDARPDWRFARR